MAKEGYRLLAIAYSEQDQESEGSNDLIFLGLVVMYDPPKEGVREAVEDCYRAGIKVTIVTGDYSLTAAAIAKQIGIVKDKYVAITGAEVESLSKQQLAKKIDTALPVIFARTTPKDKLKIVETYQSLGHVVASTGDGINDVLALRRADIGISMGKNGSDAAIESSDVVLLDDHFATIVEAVKEGRAIYSNIQKFITYILASNIPEVLPFLLMGIFNIPLALTVLLVLAVDLGTDLLPAISLGEEEPDDDILDGPPRSRNSNILDRHVLLRSYAFLGVIEAMMLFAMFFFTWNHFGYTFAEVRSLTFSIVDGSASEHVKYVYQYAITMAFGSVIACQIGNVLVCRSQRQCFYKALKKKNPLMLWGIGIEIALFLVIAYVPFMQTLFETTGPKLHHLALLLVCPFVLISLEETRKWFVRRKQLKERMAC
ncbi:HAD-IC family P-type ATPase [Bacillus massilioanorexius]|nr:HAD-IC family P-type ATPase [Bacillus massilioanorexius]